MKNVVKSSKAVLCRGICSQWYHLKCTSLSEEDFQSLAKSTKKWICEKCVSLDVTLGLEREVTDINNDLTQELETQNAIIKTLNDDLSEANEIVKQLRSHNLQLETMILKKEETIIMLERKIDLLSDKTKDDSNRLRALRSNAVDLQHSRSLAHSTPVSGDGTNSRWSFEKDKNKSFAMAVKGNNTSRVKSDKQTKDMQPSFIQNRFEVLSIDEEETPEDTIAAINNVQSDNHRPKINKMLICADSHGRDLAWNINKSQHAYEAIGYVKPGGRTKQVLESRNIEEANLDKDDALVLLCGTNDVARNEAVEVIDGITSILDTVKQTRVLLVDLPNRYDLPDWSCVNKEVRKTNQRLKELSVKYSNVILVEASNAGRHWHTRQGLHFNQQGKKWLSERISEAVTAKKTENHPASPNEEQPLPPGTESLSLGNDSPPTLDHQP